MPSCNVYAVEPEGYDDHVLDRSHPVGFGASLVHFLCFLKGCVYFLDWGETKKVCPLGCCVACGASYARLNAVW